MSRPKTKEETGTIRATLRVKKLLTDRAKEQGKSIPDILDEDYPVSMYPAQQGEPR
jgi:hypothetical protein